VKDPDFHNALFNVEDKCFFVNYKFGVLCAPKGNLTEDGMYNNIQVSADFEEFLEFLGTKVKLQGWNKFKGGLDIQNNLTGEYSYHTEFENGGIQIMYHVGPLIPEIPDDPSRKRYIGNDIVVIIFKEGHEDVFNPNIIRSHFNHIFAVIEKVPSPKGNDATYYKLHLGYKPTVPPFTPFLPDPPVFKKGPKFRNILLTKLINGERACLSMASDFSDKMTRTRTQLLEEAVKPHIKNNKKKKSNLHLTLV